MRHNSAALDNFVEIIKLMNHTGLYDVEFAWYSPGTSRRICLYGSVNSLEIHSFWPTLLCRIVEVLATRLKFLQPSSYCSVINCTLIFHATNFFFFCLFAGVMSQFELVKHNFPNKTIFPCSSVWLSNPPRSEAMRLPNTWTASVTWYGPRKLTRL